MALVVERRIPFDIGVPERMMVVTPVLVENPYTRERRTYLAVWDTGATGTCITHKVVMELNLKKYGSATVSAMIDWGKRIVYEADFYIEKIDVHYVKPAEMDAYNDGIDVAIGMDIIGNGDFSLTRQTDGSIRMRFQSPPACFSVDQK